MNCSQPKIIVIGTYEKSDAYPNTKYKIDQLLKISRGQLSDSGSHFRPKLSYKSRIYSQVKLLGILLELLAKSFYSVFCVLINRKVKVAYIPYPSTIVLFFFSVLLPKSFRPAVVMADMFVSVYDTIINDRRLFSENSVVARCLQTIERRACKTADILIVDTLENQNHFSEVLRIEKNRFRSIPLSINEAVFTFKPASSCEKFTVLFIGTLVPLHGIEVICDSIALIDQSLDIDIQFIGDGQMAPVLLSFLQKHTSISSCVNITWVQEWESSSQLAERIRSASVCIGIVSGNPKSQRVWPYKNYLYMACGRALITGETEVAKRLAQQFGDVFYVPVVPGDSQSLARAIEYCFHNQEELEKYHNMSRSAYQVLLSSNQSEAALSALIYSNNII